MSSSGKKSGRPEYTLFCGLLVLAAVLCVVKMSQAVSQWMAPPPSPPLLADPPPEAATNTASPATAPK